MERIEIGSGEELPVLGGFPRFEAAVLSWIEGQARGRPAPYLLGLGVEERRPATGPPFRLLAIELALPGGLAQRSHWPVEIERTEANLSDLVATALDAAWARLVGKGPGAP